MSRTRFPDPYEGMSDDELDQHFSELVSSHRKRQQAISIRFPEDLLTAIRKLADEFGVGYQTLIKNLLERDVQQLLVRRTVRRRTSAARATSAPARTSRKRPRGPKPTVGSPVRRSKKATESRPKVA
jgi:predicted DNA binding CopG/RHH family protein